MPRWRWYCTYWWENWACSILVLECIYSKGGIFSNIKFLNWLTWKAFKLPRLFSEQQGLDAAQGKESQQSSVTMKYVGAVLTTRRAGCRAVISVLKRQWSRMIRVRHSTATTEQTCSSRTCPRPSQEAKPAGPGQTHRGGRSGRVIVAT